VKDMSSDSDSITERGRKTITIGGKISMNPIKKLMVSAEMAGQTGNYNKSTRSAMAYQLIANYALEMKYSPALTAIFSHYSGNKDTDFSAGGTYKAWDPMFENQGTGKIYNALFSASGANIAEIRLSMSPLEDLLLSLEYSNLWLDKKFESGFTSWTPNEYATYTVTPGKKFLGNEIDLVATYNYTEDVQLGLNAGVFMPGKVFDKTNRADATQVIGSIKVTF